MFAALDQDTRVSDPLNRTLVVGDMRKHMGRWMPKEEKGIRELVAYAIAGAGFHNMEKYVKTFSLDDRNRLGKLFRKWLDGRDLVGFYRTLFERFNYTCREVALSEVLRNLTN